MPDILLYVTGIPHETETNPQHCLFHTLYRQLLASHVNPGGWNFSLFICPLSVYIFFPLLYVTYPRRTLLFSPACTADSMPACSHSSSTFTSFPQPILSLPAASPFSLCLIGSPCPFSVTGVLFPNVST